MIWDGDTFAFLGPASKILGDDRSDGSFRVRCGHCLNCRIRRAMEWKIRGIHESQASYRPTLAVTLTYDDEHLPETGSLRPSDLTLFNKRLRYHAGEFRFMACGEYGPRTGRAHYHGIYFGLSVPDLYKGYHWSSRTIRDAWGMGNVALHVATPASIGYVSGYVVKKLREHGKTRPIMETVDVDSGLVVDQAEVEREFFRASNRPGIGQAWAEQFGDQVLEQGHIIIGEKPCHVIPSYYQKLWRDRPGYEAFAARRLEHQAETPELSIDALSVLGQNVERSLEVKRDAF